MLKLKITKSLLLSTVLLLTACGGGGSSDSDDSSSNLTDDSSSSINKAPTVNAGADRKAQINVSIIIWGSASDSDGMISSYEWKKGEEVLGTTSRLDYIPTKLGIETLTLTVVDDDGVSATDSMNLEVVTEAVEIPYDDPLPF
jgi:hypothetical protein